MMLHSCSSCKLRFKMYKKWFEHLFELPHQELGRHSFLNWSDEDNLQSVVVFWPAGSVPTPAEVVKKFQSLSIMVVDFLFWEHVQRLFVIQIETKEAVEHLLHSVRLNPETLKVGKESIVLKRKCDISETEWSIIVGDANVQVGSSRTINNSAVVSDNESEDTTTSSITNGNGVRSKKRKREKSISSNGTTEAEVSICDNGEDDQKDEEPEIFVLTNRMKGRFRSTFISKFKPEMVGDDKRNVVETLKCMKKTWKSIYLGFHDKIWPNCFIMANTRVVRTSYTNDDNSDMLELTFKCHTLVSEKNKWLETSFKDNAAREEFVDKKVQELLQLLENETACSRQLKELSTTPINCSPILAFQCKISVEFNQGEDVSGTLECSELQGRNANNKMRLVLATFRKLFKEYQRMKIEKMSSNDIVELNQPSSKRNTDWHQVLTIE